MPDSPDAPHNPWAEALAAAEESEPAPEAPEAEPAWSDDWSDDDWPDAEPGVADEADDDWAEPAPAAWPEPAAAEAVWPVPADAEPSDGWADAATESVEALALPAEEPVAAGPTAPDEELSEEGARKLILLALGALVAFVLAAGVALLVSRTDDVEDDDSGLVSASQALVGTGTGPLAGTDVATYTEGRRRALDEAAGRWVAVVSLRDYVTEADFEQAHGSLDVKAKLIATPGGEPEVVEGSLERWATEARGAAEEEQRQLQSMAESTDDKAFQDQFRADMERLTKLLAALDPSKPIVFGFVVTASSTQLKELAADADIRLVDLVGRRAPSTLSRLRGLRPEETVRAADPRTRPV